MGLFTKPQVNLDAQFLKLGAYIGCLCGSHELEAFMAVSGSNNFALARELFEQDIPLKTVVAFQLAAVRGVDFNRQSAQDQQLLDEIGEQIDNLSQAMPF